MTSPLDIGTPVLRPATPGRAAALLGTAREHERHGRVADAVRSYTAAIGVATGREDARILAEALRRLGNLRRRAREMDTAADLCTRSYEAALEADDHVLAAEALNGVALVHFERGAWEEARRYLERALRLGAESQELSGRIEQNFGVMANIQGDLAAAMAHYQRSLQAFRAAQDERGCAIAHHNLGMVNADRAQWDDADRHFRESMQGAEALGDAHVRGHVLVNWTEVHLARGHYEDARRSAEEALQIFDQLGARDRKAAAYKFLGVLYRETGQTTLGEARLRAAVDLAREVGAAAEEAEASRELAVLYRQLGRNQEALSQLNAAHRLFGRLNARRDLLDVSAKVAHLEAIYLDIVREWGRSIESADMYTYGHCERVADYAAVVAAVLGLDEAERKTVRLGAYLHDLGKVRIPHEILNKPSKLTEEEFELMKRHPLFGLECLGSVELPWDIKPIVRWHHEKVDGSGYPDRLRGEEIPLVAQVICIVDVFDALTTTRSYRGAMSLEGAAAELERSRRWWRPDVFGAFADAGLGDAGLDLRGAPTGR